MKKRKKAPSLPALKRKAWDLLSKCVRLEAADEGGTLSCYCCDALIFWKDAQAAHFVPGRTGSVLLNPEVIRPCCLRCNVLLGGNYQVFTLRMIDEVGREKVEELIALKNKVVKWNRWELMMFIEDYKARLNALKLSRQGAGVGDLIPADMNLVYAGRLGSDPF